MIENLIEEFAQSLGSWAYLFVSLMAIAETAAFLGFIAPGEFTIILGGVLAGEGTLSIQLLIGIVWASIVIGDSIGFMLGRRLGRAFASRHGHRVRLTEERLVRVDEYFKRHGGKTIFLGRWVGFVRPLMPFTAGTTGMPYWRFLPYDVLSAGLFGTTFTLLGYIFWSNFETVTSVAGRGALGLGILVALVIGIVMLVRRLRDAERRRKLAATLERLGRRPALQPLAAVLRALWRVALRPLWRSVLAPIWRWLRPPLRFIGQRLTPGELGIEFTTVVAVASVCAFVFIAYTDVVSAGSSVITSADDFAYDLVRDTEAGIFTTIAKALSFFGKLGVGIAVVAIATAALLATRQFLEAATLALGFAIGQASLYITKAAVERPRPPDPLVSVDGSSFPSGHAATAAVFVAIAVLLARRLRSHTARIAVVTAAFVLAAGIGLSRVYLRVHYISDVNAGWALGLGAFAICGAVALVVSHLRNNQRAWTPRQSPT